MTEPVVDDTENSFDAYLARRITRAAAKAVAEEECRQLGGHEPTGGHGYYASGIVAARAVLRELADASRGTPYCAVELDLDALAEHIDDGATAPARDTRRWRVGRRYGIHVYAQNPGDDRNNDEAIGTMFTADAARQAVADHNRNLCAATETCMDRRAK